MSIRPAPHIIDQQLSGTPSLLGAIVAAGAVTAVDNADTAVPFTLPQGATLLVQATAALYIKFGTDASVAASNADYKIGADESKAFSLANDITHISVVGVSGAATLKVFRLR